jgi:deazaflavin-dependent oxidoreductase (nitroreductase family)
VGERDDDNRQVIEEFRAHGGLVGGPLAGTPMLLLTVTGARTSRPRTVPVAYLDDGDRRLVAASNLGARKNPDWYYGLVAHPDVSVEVGDETYGATAIALHGDERDRAYSRWLHRYPCLAGHQARSGRTIPMVALVRQT